MEIPKLYVGVPIAKMCGRFCLVLLLCSLPVWEGARAEESAPAVIMAESGTDEVMPPQEGVGHEEASDGESSPRVSIGRGLIGVACLLVPVVLIVLVVRVLLGRGKSSLESVTEVPSPSPVEHQPVRMVKDGFWIDGEWEVGTSLVVHYVIGGVNQEQALIYQPEEGGQFVFTGVTPDSVTVVMLDGEPIPPPVVTPPPIMPETRDDCGSVSPVPPVDPNA